MAPSARDDHLQGDVIPDQTTDPSRNIHGPTDKEPVMQRCTWYSRKGPVPAGFGIQRVGGWTMESLAVRLVKKVLCAAKSDEPISNS